MDVAKFVVALLVFSTACVEVTRAGEADADQWRPIQRFLGEWSGTASGGAGEGTVMRKYSFVMNGRFVHETNTSRYPPQEKNKQGEIHEHWGIFSYDKARRLLVLRQFHGEGFVNTYRQASPAEGSALLVFESEGFENFSNSWKARETYKFLSDDEFVETFELAGPGKPFSVYSRNHLKRVMQ